MGAAILSLGQSTVDPQLGARYAVTLPMFEGPLDLLLQLIEQEQLDISEVSLVAVTDQYLRTLEQLEEVVPGAMADFLVVASRLLLIKSARLLPRPPGGDEGGEEEPGDSLVGRLIEYRKFRMAAGSLRLRQELGMRVYVRPPGGRDLFEMRPRATDLRDVDLSALHAALQRALQRAPETPALPKVHTYAITVAEQIAKVRRRMAEALASADERRKRARISFMDLLDADASRVEIVVTFLAVLEMIKQRELQAAQSATFGDIVLVPARPTDD